jgi:hypothetical protein
MLLLLMSSDVSAVLASTNSLRILHDLDLDPSGGSMVDLFPPAVLYTSYTRYLFRSFLQPFGSSYLQQRQD